jgi:hypothetical protein
MLYISLAFPSALLIVDPSSLYRPMVSKSDADRLFDLAMRCLPAKVTSVQTLDLYVGIITHLIFIGQALQIHTVSGAAFRFAVDNGMFDESSIGWRNLNHDERNDWRRISWGVFSMYRFVIVTEAISGPH